MRIQVEEMHVYYFIARKLISNAKLGFMGIMAGPEERLLNNIYNSWKMDEIEELSKKLLDKLDKEQTQFKINTNSHSLKDTEELISEAVSYTANLLFKPEVLENVRKILKVDLSTHDKIILCIDKICQTKRVLSGLSPDERKKVLDGKGIEVGSNSKGEKTTMIQAVDEENVSNTTEVEVEVSVPNIDVSEIPLDEEVVEAIDDVVDEGNKQKSVFTAEDMPVDAIENLVNGVDLVKETKKEEVIEEEIEILDFEDAEETEVVEELIEENTFSEQIVEFSENVLGTVEENVIEDKVLEIVEEKPLRDQIIVVSDRKPSVLKQKVVREKIIIVSDRKPKKIEEKLYFEVPEIIEIIE